MKRRRMLTAFLREILAPLLVVAAVLCMFTALSNLEQGRDDTGRAQLETGIRRAALTCYAAEGIYPPTLEYLCQHYGLQVDAERYTVYYTVTGSNLVPDITVLRNGD